LDFVGEINPNSSGKHKYNLTKTYFFTKWVESIPTRETTDTVIMRDMCHFKEKSITQQKNELGLQFSTDHRGMLSLLKMMLVPYLFLPLI
jgi:hypothetical protein